MAEQPYAVMQMRDVSAQVAAATTTAGVLSLTALPDYSQFVQAPVDIGGAFRHAAFWCAVAARALGDRDLVGVANGYAVRAVPFVAGTGVTTGMESVITGAAEEIKRAIERNPATRSTASGALANIAYSKLAVMPTQLAKAQAEDTSIMGQIRNFMAGLGRLLTALKVIAVIGGIAGLSGVAWWAWKRSRAKA